VNARPEPVPPLVAVVEGSVSEPEPALTAIGGVVVDGVVAEVEDDGAVLRPFGTETGGVVAAATVGAIAPGMVEFVLLGVVVGGVVVVGGTVTELVTDAMLFARFESGVPDATVPFTHGVFPMPIVPEQTSAVLVSDDEVTDEVTATVKVSGAALFGLVGVPAISVVP
jgi:hypothetical protein